MYCQGKRSGELWGLNSRWMRLINGTKKKQKAMQKGSGVFLIIRGMMSVRRHFVLWLDIKSIYFDTIGSVCGMFIYTFFFVRSIRRVTNGNSPNLSLPLSLFFPLLFMKSEMTSRCSLRYGFSNIAPRVFLALDEIIHYGRDHIVSRKSRTFDAPTSDNWFNLRLTLRRVVDI